LRHRLHRGDKMEYKIIIRGKEYIMETLKLTMGKLKLMRSDPMAVVDVMSEIITPSIDDESIDDISEFTEAIKKATLNQKKTTSTH